MEELRSFYHFSINKVIDDYACTAVIKNGELYMIEISEDELIDRIPPTLIPFSENGYTYT